MIPNIQPAALNAKTLQRFFLFGFVIVATAAGSRQLGLEGLPISIIWPPSGLILGAGLVLGLPVVVFSAALLAAWLMLAQGASLAPALLLAGSELAGATVGIWLVRRVANAQSALQTQNRERVRYLYAGLAAATVTAAIGAGAMILAMGNQWSFSGHDVFLVYWLLEGLSVLLFAPLAYYVLINPRRFIDAVREDIRSRVMRQWYLSALVLTALVWVLPDLADSTYALAMAFAFFPLLCWLVLTARPASVLALIPLMALLFMVFSLKGLAGLPALDTINQVVRSLLMLTGLILLVQVIAVMNHSRNQLLDTFRQQANTDFLSGLNNDRAFAARVDGLLAAVRNQPLPAMPSPREHWLVYLQVLDFDNLEDLLGFRASRNLELMFAARLMGTCGPDAYPARLGNGIFSLVILDADKPALDRWLQTLYDAFDDQTFGSEGHHTRVRVSVGAVRLDGLLADQSQYLSAATQASLMARERLPRIQVVWDVEGLMRSRRGMTQRLELLKDALSEDRLVLFAQPICPIGRADDKLSYEILIRLQDTNGDYLPPGVFLPIAEAYGFMRQIDQWVIRHTLQALADNPEWLARTRKCSINLAGTSLSSDEILGFVAEQFEATGVPPHKIGFEVTETQHIQSRDMAERVTQGLRAMGCGVSLDDFGTGLASFDYLKSFRFDTLKIDGVFIKSLIDSEHDRRIVKATCDVARGMGLKTVAEFVENQAVADLLEELGVDYGQGYGLGKPEPLAGLFRRPAVVTA
ncbi:sensor domain-containing phosphodiesterase [Marinobacter sp. C2H3]|uniref:sensor domain-containing phosphodiesterase n=1 Tax=Marinobacter sp. C2H3 TaxID=3119003 RepID=UPI00300EEDDB